MCGGVGATGRGTGVGVVVLEGAGVGADDVLGEAGAGGERGRLSRVQVDVRMGRGGRGSMWRLALKEMAVKGGEH